MTRGLCCRTRSHAFRSGNVRTGALRRWACVWRVWVCRHCWRCGLLVATEGSGKPLLFTSGSAVLGVFSGGDGAPDIVDVDAAVPYLGAVFSPASAHVPPKLVETFGSAMAEHVETDCVCSRCNTPAVDSRTYGRMQQFRINIPSRGLPPTNKNTGGRSGALALLLDNLPETFTEAWAKTLATAES